MSDYFVIVICDKISLTQSVYGVNPLTTDGDSSQLRFWVIGVIRETIISFTAVYISRHNLQTAVDGIIGFSYCNLQLVAFLF